MKRLFDSLSEKINGVMPPWSTKLGHGGIEYIARLCSAIPRPSAGVGGTRSGRRSGHHSCPKKGWTEKADRDRRCSRTNFFKVLQDHTPAIRCGPMSNGRTCRGRDRAVTALGTPVSRESCPSCSANTSTARERLEEEDNGSSQSQSQRPVREHRPLEEGVSERWPASHQHGHQEEGVAGRFLPRGKAYTDETIEVNDHDFSSAGSGVVIPHGLYDVGKNKGFVHLNTSHDTSELACDSLARGGIRRASHYPLAKKCCCCAMAAAATARPCICSKKTSKAGEPARHRDSRGPLPALLLQVQSDRAPPLSHLTRACRRDLLHARDRSLLHGQGQNEKGLKAK